ncbi:MULTISPECIES: helix-turn-helix transcriptional regulator [unclassified Amycolatopsis]|uniref:helix-turn-helix transcriptional regulator n=1 Tax=unclassified Amycolatopsis TaxID=2618356 RepID=UPI001C69CD13|nr:helix-turn-helix transcriptional regulator [Amycolatopsis sp. DSM 110486]QYN20394.1 helix-turn-helix transcriptional regulator [Amycolatopsis sp. DSM 110486]
MPEKNQELADFLRRARSQCDPARSGLPTDSRIRRVPGLRREEVALLAGVSTDYYARLEQGRRIVPSPAVLEALGRALNLDAAGRAHLEDLVGLVGAGNRARPTAVQRVRPGLYQLLGAFDSQPTLVLGRRTDVLAANRMARALFADFDAMRPSERNYARWMFLDDDARSLFVDWDVQARAVVENLRLEIGADRHDRGTAALITDLRERSTEFGQWWDEHRVYQRTHGAKRLRHRVVGDLTVDYETLTPVGDPDTTLYVYTAEPDSPSQRALNLLGSWALSEGSLMPPPAK